MIEFKFPENFLWGVACSSFQVEGAAYEGGKGLNIWDVLCRDNPEDFEGQKSPNDGADFYYHYKQDIKDMKELGLKSFRFSISWSRIFPKNMTEINYEGIKFYNNIIDTLLENDIEPLVDIYHWDLPQHIAAIGGMLNPEVIELFCQYAKVCFDNFGDRVKLWSTINEPSVIAFAGYEVGSYPPFHKNLKEALLVAHNLIIMHYKTVKLYKAMELGGKIGAVIAFVPIYAATGEQVDQIASVKQVDIIANWWLRPFFEGKYPDSILQDANFKDAMPDNYISELENNFTPIDFIGVNYYNPYTVKHETGARLNSTSAENFYVQSDYGFLIYSQGLFDSLHYIKEKYNNPLIYITENGIGLNDNGVEDKERENFLQEHLRSIARATKTGVNVMGYYYWSYWDTFEGKKAYKFKFGLRKIDFASNEKTRTNRDSWYYYQNIISKNGIC